MAHWRDIFEVKKQSIELDLRESEYFLSRFWSGLSLSFRVTLIIFLLGCAPAYYLTRTVAKKIGDNYFKSYLISAHPSFSNPKPLLAGNVGVLNLGNNEFAAYSEVTNQNLDLSAESFSYKFTFYSQSGRSVQTIPGKSYILANQKKYIIVPKFESVETIASGKLEFDPVPWQKKISIPAVHLSAGQATLSDQSSPVQLVADGSVLNDSPYGLGTVTIKFLLYNKTGKIVGVSQRDEFRVNSFERRAYKQFWSNLDTGSAARAEVYAETNPLDSNNLSLQSLQTSPSSNLGR